MAKKRGEVALQKELVDQEEWDEYIGQEGLLIIDVYQDWCGPCKALISMFRRIKNESGDDLLQFAIAKADTIETLQRYRGRCEPCFLFFGGGVLVDVIRGANPPVLEAKILAKLAEEHSIISGEKERMEIKDPYFLQLDLDEKLAHERAEAKANEIEVEVTLALIKPDAVMNGKVDEIIDRLRERNINILEHQERQLTEEEVQSFYSKITEESYFENFMSYMTSGTSHILLLDKGEDGIIDEFRELLGPKDVDEAREQAPESLRAEFGTVSYQNALHASSTAEAAKKEIEFFFPTFQPSTYTRKSKKEEESGKPEPERTLGILLPDCYAANVTEIMEQILEAQITVAMKREVTFNEELFQRVMKEEMDNETLKDQMFKAPSLAFVLTGSDVVNRWNSMLGPRNVETAKAEMPSSLRAQFAIENVLFPAIYGSENKERAAQEISVLFPVEQTVAVIKPDAFEYKDEITEKIKEQGFTILSHKELELTRDMINEMYKKKLNTDYFEDIVASLQKGPSLIMVLSREDAIQGWRSLIGPTDPKDAGEVNVNSFRSIYGKSIVENAVHGSSNAEHASEELQLIFGSVEFDTKSIADSVDEERQSRHDGILSATDERVVMDAEEAQAPAEDAEGSRASGRRGEEDQGTEEEASEVKIDEASEEKGEETNVPIEGEINEEEAKEEAETKDKSMGEENVPTAVTEPEGEAVEASEDVDQDVEDKPLTNEPDNEEEKEEVVAQDTTADAEAKVSDAEDEASEEKGEETNVPIEGEINEEEAKEEAETKDKSMGEENVPTTVTEPEGEAVEASEDVDQDVEDKPLTNEPDNEEEKEEVVAQDTTTDAEAKVSDAEDVTQAATESENVTGETENKTEEENSGGATTGAEQTATESEANKNGDNTE